MWSEDCEGTGATAKLRLSDKVTRSSWTGTGTYRRALAVILGLAYFGLLGQAWRCQERPANAPAQSTVSEDLVLPDGTVLRLRLTEEVSSADARVGDAVVFNVLEEVAIGGVVVIPVGSTARGFVAEVRRKGRLGRGGNLQIALDYVELADSEKISIRAVKNAKGCNHKIEMGAGMMVIVALFPPVFPVPLLMRGEDAIVRVGTQITAQVEGDVRLDPVRFAGLPTWKEATDEGSAESAPSGQGFTGGRTIENQPDHP